MGRWARRIRAEHGHRTRSDAPQRGPTGQPKRSGAPPALPVEHEASGRLTPRRDRKEGAIDGGGGVVEGIRGERIATPSRPSSPGVTLGDGKSQIACPTRRLSMSAAVTDDAPRLRRRRYPRGCGRPGRPWIALGGRVEPIHAGGRVGLAESEFPCLRASS